MKRFSFSLQSVLGYWHFQTERLQTELQVAGMEWQRLHREQNQVEESLARESDRLSRLDDVFVDEMDLSKRYLVRLKLRVSLLKKAQEEALEKRERIRNELVEARQKEKTLEILKKRALEKYNRKLDQKLQNELDEYHLFGTFRKKLFVN